MNTNDIGELEQFQEKERRRFILLSLAVVIFTSSAVALMFVLLTSVAAR